MVLRPAEILKAARDQKELSSLQTLILLEAKDQLAREIIELADERNRATNGGQVSYVRAVKIHYTNICRAKCKVCSFYRLKGQDGAFALDPSEIVSRVRRAQGITQVYLSGGLNPDLNLRYHVKVLEELRAEFPELHIHGYSPTEIMFLARRGRMHFREVLRTLRQAGLDSLSGDSAILLNDKLRKKLCSDKLSANDWIDIIRAAHSMGIPTTATMLFGHIENEVLLSEHLDILKRMQRDTGHFTCLELVPFIPHGAPILRERNLPHRATLDFVERICAIVRLAAGQLFRNIGMDWIKVGVPGIERVLRAGVNDLGPLSFDLSEIRPDQANGRTSISAQALQAAVRRAGFIPVERKPHTIRRPAIPTFAGHDPEPAYLHTF